MLKAKPFPICVKCLHLEPCLVKPLHCNVFGFVPRRVPTLTLCGNKSQGTKPAHHSGASGNNITGEKFAIDPTISDYLCITFVNYKE